MGEPTPRPGLRDVPPYRAPQLDVPARLNTNECPYSLPDVFLDELADAVRAIAFNRYPDRDCVQLREALAAHAGHVVEGVWPANGSNEVIQQLLLAYGGPGRRALLFTPTYVLHSHLAWMTHTDVVPIDTPDPFEIGDRQVSEAARLSPDIAFVCSPNNPTGNVQPIEAVERLAGETPALVIVDEAYVEFGGTTAAGLVAERPNVVVVRTFSKAFALAAARIGYCLASPRVVDDLQRVRLPYHLSATTQAAGTVALTHADDAMKILDAIRRERDRLFQAMSELSGVHPYPSDANFVLFRTERSPREAWQGLLDRGVLVRDMSGVVPGCLRVSVGTTEEGDLFLGALREVTE
jgi:histidinol-phosphate aminotransferase